MAGTAATIGIGAVSVAAVLFFRTEGFDSEYRPVNKKIAGKLFQEFTKELDEWYAERKTIAREEDFNALYPQIQRLSSMASMFEQYNKNVILGKSLLRRIAAMTFLGGLMLSGALAVASLGDPLVLGWAYLLVLFLMFPGMYGYGFTTQYIRLVRDLDAKDADLGVGKPVFDQSPRRK